MACLVEALSPLLMQLAEAKAKTTRCDADAESPVLDELFKKIEGEIGFIKDILVRLERWEREVQDEFGVIANHLDDIEGHEDEWLQLKLHIVNEKISNLKAHMTPPLELPSSMPTATPTRVTGSSSSDSLDQDILAYANDGDQSDQMVSAYIKEKGLPGDRNDNLVNMFFQRGNHVLNYQNKVDIVPILYRTVRKYIRQVKECCLVSLSVFPENAVIKKRMLIYLWYAASSRTYEDAAELWLDGLIKSNLLTPIYRVHNSATDSFRVPSAVRDQLIRFGMGSSRYSRIPHRSTHVLFSDSSRYSRIPNRSTHVVLSEPAEEEDVFSSYVRICINVNRSYLKFEKSKFMRMKKIFALHLGRWQTTAKHHIEVENTEFLDWLGTFEALRYLSLRGISRIMHLPSSIGRLTNLTILDLRACHNLDRLPQEVTKLKSLTHLDVSECPLLDHIPKGMGSLSELQVFKGFVIGSSIRHDPCQLKELSKLKKLRKLTINIRRDSLVGEWEHGLLSFEALRSLTITWGEGLSRNITRVGVSIPLNLNKLDLRCFPENSLQHWILSSSSKLQKLYIRGGKMRSIIVNRDFAWPIEILRLRLLNGLDVDKSQLLKVFPNLVYLEIHECKRLRSTAGWFSTWCDH